jgi:hypothetical protein
MTFFFFQCNFFHKSEEIKLVAYSLIFREKSPNSILFFKLQNSFATFLLTWILIWGIFKSSFSLFGQVLETCHHLMLNPLGMLTIDATSENWGGKEKKTKQ